MKYLVILILVVMVARIDWLLRQIDHVSGKFSSRPVEVEETQVANKPDIIPISQDKALEQSPKQVFMALMDDVHNNPNGEVRARAITYLKDHPTLFNTKLDTELESSLFSWRDMLALNEPEAINFLLDMLTYLPDGENQVLLKRFFSVWMDINMENFIASYARTKDTNCSVAAMFGDRITDDVKINGLKEREVALKAFLVKPGIDPVQMKLANNCLLVVGLALSKLNPFSEATEEPAITIAPEPAPEGSNP